MSQDTSTPSVDEFLRRVLRSGLMNQRQLDEALSTLNPTDPETLASALVTAGKLSRFQARKLLQGKTRGLIIGPYHVLAPIGKGGMSAVYLARDTRQEQLVALKVLPPKQAREEERHLARFLREMELCQKVEDPHIARTYEVGESDGVYYIAMEFIPGRSLRRVVSDDGPLDVPRAAQLFAEAATALEHAHERGLIHRDLKPSNIMVTRDGHAKLLDLGLALIEGEFGEDHRVVGGQGYVVGTMDYIAPEQSEDATNVCPRSDIYGLGATLYFALTGRPPFPGGSSMQKIMRHRSEEPVPIEQLNAAIPTGFANVVRQMMAKEPADRFASAGEVRRQLLKWTNSTDLVPTPYSGPSRVLIDPVTLVHEVESEYSSGLAGWSESSIIRLTRTANSLSNLWWTYMAPILIGGVVGLALVGLYFLLTS